MAPRRTKYQLGSRLGVGGMAEVFRATTVGVEGFALPIAVKRILPAFSSDPHFAAMFANEARISSRLRHPNIVQVLDFDRDEEGRLFLAMELVEGVSLDRVLANGALLPDAALRIATEVLKALAHAHEMTDDSGRPMGLVHRDVSPHNVLIGRGGEVKLADFGIAKAMSTATGKTSAVIKGKPSYMAPEQLTDPDQVDGRADLFAVGAILYEMLTGERYYRGSSTEEVLADVVQISRGWRIPVVPGWVGDDLRLVLQKLVAPAPAERYQHARAALDDIAPLLQAEATVISALVEDGTNDTSPAADPARALMEAETRTRLPLAPSATRRRFRPAVSGVAVAFVVLAAVVLIVPFRASSGRHASGPEAAGADAAVAARSPAMRKVTRRGDVSGAAVSHDGAQLAVLSRGSLRVSPMDGEKDSRLVAKLDVLADSAGWMTWSSDGRFVSVNGDPELTGMRAFVVEVASGRIVEFRHVIAAALVGDSEIAIVRDQVLGRGFVLYSSVDPSRELRKCVLPGDFEYVLRVSYNRKADAIVGLVSKGNSWLASVVKRDCTPVGVFALPDNARGLTAETDDDSVLFNVISDGAYEIREMNLQGVLMKSTKRAGEPTTILARHRGHDYLVSSDVSVTLERMRRSGVRELLYSATSPAVFAVSPDERSVAWIDGLGTYSGPLRVSSIDKIAEGGTPIPIGGRVAVWSPDGRQVAVTTPLASTPVSVVDRQTGRIRGLDVDRVGDAAPVWLDASHLGLQVADNTNFVSVDLNSMARSPMFTQGRGWFLSVAVSPRHDGRYAYWANAKDGSGLWVSRSAGPDVLLMRGLPFRRFRGWGATGLVVQGEGGDLSVVDPDGGGVAALPSLRLSPFQTVEDVEVRSPDAVYLTIRDERTDVFDVTDSY